ncbi:entericidin A/B family lipoprotein [Herminiimonas fonticola]|uniref:Entericidin A n=1 Tax=Herminiimonas fonticola TaxID=303380 RepID=A0A4R6G7T9_9BURK|nr:entericidin A/B family lipoprotein [Herminiimonas fonticola]RBA24071.1 putative small secreted protein [Herminiimonas fonticola]TDN90070.1 entericidin A [Herminiimonas fonticola]
MKKTVSIFLLIAFSGLLTACNTMSGLGKDVEHLGDKIQNKAAK